MRIDGVGANWVPRGAAVAVVPEDGRSTAAPFSDSWVADPDPASAGLILLHLAEPATRVQGDEPAEGPVLPGQATPEPGQGLCPRRLSWDQAPDEPVRPALPGDSVPASMLAAPASHRPPDRNTLAPLPIMMPDQGEIMPPAVASLPAAQVLAAVHPLSPVAVSSVAQSGQPDPAGGAAMDVGVGPPVLPPSPPAASGIGLRTAGDAPDLRGAGKGSAGPDEPVHSVRDPALPAVPAPSGSAQAVQAGMQATLPVPTGPVAPMAWVRAPGSPDPALPRPVTGETIAVSVRAVSAAAHPVRLAVSGPPSIMAWAMPRPPGQDAALAPVVDPVILPEAAPDPATGTDPPAQGGSAPAAPGPLPAAAGPPVLAMPGHDPLADDAPALGAPDGQAAERTVATADHPRLTDPRPVVPQLVMRLAEMARDGGPSVLEVRLDPEELGRLSLSMQTEGDVLRVHLVAERSDTLDLMRRHAADLAAELREAGFDSVAFSFGKAGRDAGAGQTPYARPPMPEDAGSALLPETGGAARVAGDRALDLRL